MLVGTAVAGSVFDPVLTLPGPPATQSNILSVLSDLWAVGCACSGLPNENRSSRVSPTNLVLQEPDRVLRLDRVWVAFSQCLRPDDQDPLQQLFGLVVLLPRMFRDRQGWENKKCHTGQRWHT